MANNTKNPYRSPASNATSDSLATSSESSLRLVLVVAMYLVTAVGNVIAVLRPEGVLIRLMLSLALCSIVAYWCVVDSRLRGFPIVHSLHWIIFFTWPIAVPIYLIWSRRLRGLGLAFVHGIGLYAACLATYHLTGYIAYGAEWFQCVQ